MGMAQEWRAGWKVVLAAAMGAGLGTTPIYSFGAFIPPLTAEFGWSRAEIATAISISAMTTGLASPFIGRMIDRWGARRWALTSAIFLCAAFASLSLVNGSVSHFLTIWMFVALGTAASSPLVWTIAVATRFDRSRGFALSLALCGTNLAGVLAAPLVTGLTQHFGWRTAYTGLALYMFLSTVPLAVMFFYDAGDLERWRHSTSSRASKAHTTGHSTDRDGMNLRQAVSDPTFWIIAISFLLGGGAIVGLIVHLIPILIERGLRPMQAAGAASLMSLAAVLGRVSAGFLLDRVFAPRLMLIAFIPPILACLDLLFLPATAIGGFVAAGFVGLALGAEANMISYLTARYFGFRSYGLVYGVLFGVFSIGSALLPPLLGEIFQRTGSYHLALFGVTACYFTSAAVLQFCGPYPAWKEAS